MRRGAVLASARAPRSEAQGMATGDLPDAFVIRSVKKCENRPKFVTSRDSSGFSWSISSTLWYTLRGYTKSYLAEGDAWLIDEEGAVSRLLRRSWRRVAGLRRRLPVIPTRLRAATRTCFSTRGMTCIWARTLMTSWKKSKERRGRKGPPATASASMSAVRFGRARSNARRRNTLLRTSCNFPETSA